MKPLPSLSIRKRPGLDREALNPRDLVVELGGVDVTSGLQRLDLSIDVHELNTVVLQLGVDLAEVDLDALASIKAHVSADAAPLTDREIDEAEVIPIERGSGNEPYCGALRPVGTAYCCTLPVGHEGRHAATSGPDSRVLASWPNGDPDPDDDAAS